MPSLPDVLPATQGLTSSHLLRMPPPKFGGKGGGASPLQLRAARQRRNNGITAFGATHPRAELVSAVVVRILAGCLSQHT